MPKLKKEDWLTTEFINNFYTAKTYAEDWHYCIYKDLEKIPLSIINYNKHYENIEELILAKTANMRDNPSEITLANKLDLETWIKLLENDVDSFSSEIQLLIRTLDSYLVKLEKVETVINDTFQKAAAAKLADEDKVEELSRKEKDILDKIKSLEDAEIAMIELECITGVATVLLLLFASECIPAAAVMAGVDIAIFLAALVIDEELIKAEHEYVNIKAEADDYTCDLAELKRVLTNIQDLKASMKDVKSAVVAIGNSWKELKQNLDLLAQALESDTQFIDKNEFSQLYSDIQDSGALWKVIVEYAEKLILAEVKPADKSDVHKVVFDIAS